jgi:phage FluMu protein Com
MYNAISCLPCNKFILDNIVNFLMVKCAITRTTYFPVVEIIGTTSPTAEVARSV